MLFQLGVCTLVPVIYLVKPVNFSFSFCFVLLNLFFSFSFSNLSGCNYVLALVIVISIVEASFLFQL